MIKNSWTSSLGGDWNTSSFWSLDIVPNDSGTDVDISQPGSYVVTIANGETETVDAVAMGNLSATLSVSGVLTLTGAVPSTVFLTDGTITTTPSGVIQGSARCRRPA